jgi:hypothetical protein
MKMENANKASEATPETAPKTARFPERLKADGVRVRMKKYAELQPSVWKIPFGWGLISIAHCHGFAIVLRKHLCDKAILVSQKLWHAGSFLACIFRRAALGGTAGALVGRSGLPDAWKVDG